MSGLSKVFAAMVCLIPSALLWAGPNVTPPEGEAAPSDGSYLRVIRDTDHKPLFLETAVKRFVPTGRNTGPVVDLISCIHLGDKSYYRTLERLFDEYDVVLYEMVKENNDLVSRDDPKSENKLLAMVQRVLPALLGLEFQADAIDYKRDNFVHADLSPTQLREAIRKGNGDETTFFNRVLSDVIGQLQEESAQQPESQPLDIESFSLLSGPAGAVKLRQMIADKLDRVGLESLLGPTLDRLLLYDRNAAAMKVLQQQLSKGTKKVAIFYGAAHMPDLEKRLDRDLGLRHHSTAWVRAWDIKRENENSGLQGLLRALTNERG